MEKANSKLEFVLFFYLSHLHTFTILYKYDIIPTKHIGIVNNQINYSSLL